jgi:F-type H+-transporting ATPase subunit alpha
VAEFLADLMDRLHSENKDLVDRINESGELSDEDEAALGQAIQGMVDDFGPDFDEEGNPLEEGESDRIKRREGEEAAATTELPAEEREEAAATTA